MSSNGAPHVAPKPGPRTWWQGHSPRRRRTLKRVLGGVILVVLLVAVVLARWLSVENNERDADLALVQAEARGDVHAMLGDLSGCRSSRACTADVRAVAALARVRRPGAVKILQLTSATAYALSGTTGKTRFAWTVLGTLPVVQCITVQRTGNLLTGIHVRLLAISPPIENEAVCGKRTQQEKEELEEAKELSGS